MTPNAEIAQPPVLPVIAAPPVIAPRRPRVWTVFVLYLAALGTSFVVSGIVITVLAAIRHGSQLQPEHIMAEAMTGPGMLLSLAATLLIITTAAVTGALLSPIPWRQRLRLLPVRVSVPKLLIVCLGGWGVGLILQALTELSLVPRSEVLEHLEQMIRALPPAGLVAAVVIIGLLPGLAEELLFRGYIQTRLRERWGSRWAILVTALLFGVMHFDFVHGSFAVVIGLYLGYLTEQTGSILPAMLCHAVNNLLATLLSAGGFEITGPPASLMLLLTGFLLVLVGLWQIRRKLF